MKPFSNKTIKKSLKITKKKEINVCQNSETLIKVEQKGNT